MKNLSAINRLNPSWLRLPIAMSLLAALLAIMTADSQASLIAYDPMNYTGSQINTGTAAPTGTPTQTTGGGFTGNWAGGALTLNSFGTAYPNLPAAGKSIGSLGANNLYTHIASAPTSGSVWVSFLFKQASDNGGNRSGVFLEGSSGAGVMLSYQQYGAAQGEPCLMAMTGTTTVGTQIGTSANLQTYANTNLYVLQFTYSGNVVTSVAVYSNPTAGQVTPPAPDFTVSSGLPGIGALVNFGLYDGSAMSITLDEFRVGTSFGDVVGVSVVPLSTAVTSPTNNQTVSIYNFTATATATIVPGSVTNVGFYVDSILVSNVAAAPYTTVVSGVAPGAHALYTVASDGSGNTATSPTINLIAADLPPSVALANPATNTLILAGTSVSLGATAADDGSVANVAFYVDGSWVGNSASAPYGASWTVTPGVHAVTAVATDNASQNTTSSVVTVTGTLPSVSVTSPTNSQNVSLYSFKINASASVSPGTITNVAFYVDSVLITNQTAAPYSGIVYGAAPGGHALYAVATDNNGNAVTSTVINVTAADLPPSVTLTNPVANASILAGSVVTLGASAADDDTVTNVAFFVDGSLAGNSITAPYSANWTAISGVHTLTAVATDSAGQSTTSAVVTVTGTLPNVSILSPTNTQAVSIYSYKINASASVSPGTITNVAFYVDAALLTNETASPYADTVMGASAGAHALYVVATDSNGNQATSAVINVTASDLPPSVTITNPVAGNSALVGSTITLGASATDDSAVTNVAFYADGNLVGNATAIPYSLNWNVTALGTHSLTAVATDNAGQSSTSAVVTVTAVLNFNAYEPFAYPTGAFTNLTPTTATGFKGNWAGSSSGTVVAGLSYTGLPVSNNALQCNGGYQIENLAGTVSSGSVYVSVLFQQAGDNGGNRSGFLMEDSTGKGVMFAYTQASGSQGYPSLVAVTATNTVGTTYSTHSSTLRTYSTANLYIFKLTYTAGALTSVAVYSNPTAGQSTAPTADFTVSSLTGIGAISRLGVASPSGEVITIDEVRFGNSFGVAAGVPLPSAPGGVAATPGDGRVSLAWTASTNGSPTGYNIKRSTVSGLETTIASTSGLAYTDTSAVDGTIYYYEISGTNAAGEGYSSAEVVAIPLAAPGQAQNLTATPGVNVVNLNWDATANASGYLVLRGTVSGVYTVTNAVAANSAADVTAVGGTAYYYAVQATNSAGVGPLSTETTATPAIAAPLAPASVVATPGNGQVALTWTVGLGAANYNVKRSSISGAEATIAVAIGTNYTDLTALDGAVYYYEISSTNSAGESDNSAEIVAAMPPAAPTGLVATPGSNQVSLSWTAAIGASGAVSYNIKRSLTSGSGYVTIGSTGASTTTYADTTAISGTSYYYVVSGVNASGQSLNSSEANATPSGAPQAPTGVMIQTNYTSLTLSWTAAQGAPAHYTVKRATTSGAETPLAGALTVTGTTFTDTTVAIGTTYFYTVSAANDSGESADSAEVSGAAPGEPSAYESFDYGSLANGNATTASGFTGNWMITNGAAIVDGLSAPYLYTSNNALQVSSGNQYENLAVPLFSGSVFVSFLYEQSGDFGGNRGGLQLLNRQGNGVMFAYHQYGGQAGLPSIDAVTGYNSVGSELGVSSNPQTYATANLYVMRLDYDASGALTNIAFYSNPAPGQPAPAPDFSVTSGLAGLGSITTLGMHTGISTVVDEWRVGTSFSDVVVGQPYAAVTLGNLNQTYDGTAKSVTVTTAPPALTVDLTYDGSADAPTNIGSYQVIGTIDDPVYYGSATNTLVIAAPAVNTAPTNIVTTISGNQLTLSWPADHTGWTLQTQTNSLNIGLTSTWYDVPGSTGTNQITLTIDPTLPSVFYRIKN